MHQHSLFKAGLLALALVLLFIVVSEISLRSKGIEIAYDDGPELWSHHRGRVYNSGEKATVFIGSSRIKYDLDIPTWQQLTGTDAIQLAVEGNSPLPVLDDLAADEKFNGRLIVDVTEGLFFSTQPPNLNFPKENIEYFQERSPTQRASFAINRGLESQLVFLERDYYSLSEFFNRLELKNREGVFSPPHPWPVEFGRNMFDRQTKMMDRFITDSSLQKKVTDIWMFYGKINKEKPAEGKKLDSILQTIKTATDKIRHRGGEVVFVRTPSSGPYWQVEQQGFPREKYWNKLLEITGCAGIHFQDNPVTAALICPEWSHLSPSDAVIYTREFVNELRQKKLVANIHSPAN